MTQSIRRARPPAGKRCTITARIPEQIRRAVALLNRAQSWCEAIDEPALIARPVTSRLAPPKCDGGLSADGQRCPVWTGVRVRRALSCSPPAEVSASSITSAPVVTSIRSPLLLLSCRMKILAKYRNRVWQTEARKDVPTGGSEVDSDAAPHRRHGGTGRLHASIHCNSNR